MEEDHLDLLVLDTNQEPLGSGRKIPGTNKWDLQDGLNLHPGSGFDSRPCLLLLANKS